MTAEEAIKEFKDRIELGKKEYLKDIPEYIEALDMAIEALVEVEQYRALGTVEELKEAKEKQIAKKPESKQRFADLWLGVCPSCTANGVNSEMGYCDKCGQAIDWSEEE